MLVDDSSCTIRMCIGNAADVSEPVGILHMLEGRRKYDETGKFQNRV